MEFDPESCRFSGLNNDALRPTLIQLGFTNLLRRIGDDPTPVPSAKVNAGLLPRFQESLWGDTDIKGSVPILPAATGADSEGIDPLLSDLEPGSTGPLLSRRPTVITI